MLGQIKSNSLNSVQSSLSFLATWTTCAMSNRSEKKACVWALADFAMLSRQALFEVWAYIYKSRMRGCCSSALESSQHQGGFVIVGPGLIAYAMVVWVYCSLSHVSCCLRKAPFRLLLCNCPPCHLCKQFLNNVIPTSFMVYASHPTKHMPLFSWRKSSVFKGGIIVHLPQQQHPESFSLRRISWLKCDSSPKRLSD